VERFNVERIASIRSPRCAVCSMSASESLYRSRTMHSDWSSFEVDVVYQRSGVLGRHDLHASSSLTPDRLRSGHGDHVPVQNEQDTEYERNPQCGVRAEFVELLRICVILEETRPNSTPWKNAFPTRRTTRPERRLPSSKKAAPTIDGPVGRKK
jgi:hypothetical protein